MIVPLASVIPQRGEHVVFVASSNLAKRTVVKLHQISGQDAILSEGLQPGDALIVSGHRGLQDGVPVTIDGAGE
jgi:membrane fusion protein (multidrug efflux system)